MKNKWGHSVRPETLHFIVTSSKNNFAKCCIFALNATIIAGFSASKITMFILIKIMLESPDVIGGSKLGELLPMELFLAYSLRVLLCRVVATRAWGSWAADRRDANFFHLLDGWSAIELLLVNVHLTQDGPIDSLEHHEPDYVHS